MPDASIVEAEYEDSTIGALAGKVLAMGWIRRHWMALLALIPLIPLLIKWGVSMIRLGGDADFLVSLSTDPRWVSTLLDWVINPPNWSILPLLVIGLALIWWDSRRNRGDEVQPDHGDTSADFATPAIAVAHSDSENRDHLGSSPLSSTPLNENSVFVYIRGARVRRLDKAIADELGRPIEGPPAEYPIVKEAEAFEIDDVAVLDRLLAENEAEVLAMAPYVAPSTPMYPGHSISVLFRVLTARLGSTKAIAEHYRALDHQGDLEGYAEHLLESYKQMSPQHVRLFRRALHVSKIMFQMPKLSKDSAIHLTFTAFNGTGETIRLQSIAGYIKAAIGDDARPRAIGRLPRPKFYHLTETRVDAFSEFHFSIEQDIPAGLAAKMTAWEDGKSFVLDFEDLDIFVQSTSDPHKVARLPIWDSMVLTRHGKEIKSNQRGYLRPGRPFPFKNLSQG